MAKKANTNAGDVLRKVAVGAVAVGAAVLAAKALSDEDTRTNIKNTAKKVQDKGKEIFEELKSQGGDITEKFTAEFDKFRKEIEESANGKKFKAKLEDLSEKVEKLKDTGAEKVEETVADLKEKMEELREKASDEKSSEEKAA